VDIWVRFPTEQNIPVEGQVMPPRPPRLGGVLYLHHIFRRESNMQKHYRSSPDTRLQEALDEAEAASTPESKEGRFALDQIAFMIGSIPLDQRLKYMFKGQRPKLEALIYEIHPLADIHLVLISISKFRERENSVGRIADLLCKVYKS
jgi:hypothetical protein